jgi:hypothetical protein
LGMADSLPRPQESSNHFANATLGMSARRRARACRRDPNPDSPCPQERFRGTVLARRAGARIIPFGDRALWSPVVATGGSRRKSTGRSNRRNSRKQLPVRCDHLPFKAHGKEGVGRQPRRGLSPAGRPPRSFQLPSGRHGQGSQRSPSAAPEIAQIAYFDRHRPSRLHPVNGVLSRASKRSNQQLTAGQPNVCLRGEGRAAAPLTRTAHASAQGAAFAPSLRFGAQHIG